MKKLILLLLAIYGGWQFYNKNKSVDASLSRPSEMSQVPKPQMTPANVHRSSESTTQFRCDGRQYCSQMTSRAEAEFFLKNCPNTKMDGDRDGIPCERDSRW
ncbi:MAG: excalibur calcium-binding domain-containing protein [Alishewanella agri]|nr:excalibur calcium-binding domain-containing protein [Alishewanella agri]